MEIPLIFNLVFIVIILFVCFSVIRANLSFAPWVPIFAKDINRALDLAKLKPGEIFYDLGCGNGRMCLAAARRGARSRGVELSWPLYFVCKLRMLKHRELSLEFRFGNLFKADIHDADVVYLFGIPKTLGSKITEKLKKELKPGTRVISYCFDIADWKPNMISKPTEKDLPINLYIV